jgi:hypothetical protein
VVWELERREEERIAAELARYLQTPHDFPAVLSAVARLVISVKRRLGSTLFRAVLGLHFAPTRPRDEQWTEHPVVVGLVAEIARRRDAGELDPGIDPYHSATFFLLGLYGLLSTAKLVRGEVLDNYVAAALRGMVAHDR